MEVPRPSEPVTPETRPIAVPRQRAPETQPSGPPPRPVPGRRRRLRRFLLVALLVVAVTAAGAVGYAFIWYDQETKPDRSTPDAAMSNYLRALLVDRDDTRAALFACPDGHGLAAIRDLRSSIEEREKRLNVTVLVSWGPLSVRNPPGKTATVETEIRQSASIDGNLQSVVDLWTFRIEDRNGWRVCSATRTP